MVKTLYLFPTGDGTTGEAEGRAKDGAISPRLANRYSRFALSHRPGYGGVFATGRREQRVEISQVPLERREPCKGAAFSRAERAAPSGPLAREGRSSLIVPRTPASIPLSCTPTKSVF